MRLAPACVAAVPAVLAAWLVACADRPARPPTWPELPADTQPPVQKPLAFSLLEDYDKGDPLREVARDFALMRELGIRTWRGSFGWDDYEPARGQYDFEWLGQFVALARREGITLRPYIGYTPGWASNGGSTKDGQVWNDPPASLDAWGRFVSALATAMRPHGSIASYEIYNEQNAALWWDGTAEAYAHALVRGAAAVRAADPGARVLLGGLVSPDAGWLREVCEASGAADAFDVLPVHLYAETWPPDAPVEEATSEAFDTFVDAADEACGRKPIWVNEAGYATTRGRTERQQANWWVRAVATLASEPRVEHIGVYEVKDLRPDSDVIGEPANYHLGLLRVDRTPKLAAAAVRMLVALFATDALRVHPGAAQVRVASGPCTRLVHHAFVRPDGARIFVVWNGEGACSVDVRLREPTSAGREHHFDGRTAALPVEGREVRDLRLESPYARVFEFR